MERTLGDELREQESGLVRRNAARRIHEAIKQAKAKQASPKRWPWELVQNACDAVTNAGDDSSVTIRVDLNDDVLRFEHTGGFFTPEDLSLLILGGSIKELRPVRHSGRFGSGFIVTHILSEKVTVEGQAKRSDGTIQDFQFDLDRSGTADEILQAIEKAYEQLERPQSDKPTARYTYRLQNPDARQAARVGLQTFEELTPYVLAFEPRLKSVEVSIDGAATLWERGGEIKEDGVSLLSIKITKLGDELFERNIVMIRIRIEDSAPWVAVAAESGNDGSLVLKTPTKVVPKLFYPFPLLGRTEQLGLPVAIGGDFYPTEERDDILLSGSTPEVDRNKELVRKALKAIPVLAEYAIAKGWQGAHFLARVTAVRPESGVAEPEWWNSELRTIVNELSKRKILLTQRKRVAKPQDEEIMFPLPLLEYKPGRGDTYASDIDLEKLWDVADDIAEVPAPDIANDWQLTVREWDLLLGHNSVEGVIDLKWLRDEVHDRKNLTELAAAWFSGDQTAAVRWLNSLFRLLEHYEAETGRGLPWDFLEGLVPSQKGVLRAPGELRRDDGIPEPLKDIAEEFGWPIRETLLDNRFSSQWLDAKVKGKLNKGEVVQKLISEWMTWKEGGKVEPKKAQPAVKLAAWMALDEEDWTERAVLMPVFGDDYVVWKIGQHPALLPPISQWKPSDRNFKLIFEFDKSRFLAESYVQDRNPEDAKAIVRKLANWGVIYPDLVWLVQEVSLDSKDLKFILKERPEKPLKGQHTLRSSDPARAISVIPFLVPELVGALGQDPERAIRFAEFLLEVVVKRHPDWRKPLAVSCSCGDRHEIYPAEWLAHLRTKSWVPYRASDEDEYKPKEASSETIKQLLGKSLQGFTDTEDGRHLLEFLGFDSVQLYIEKLTAGDEGKREKLASLLAKVPDLDVLERLLDTVQDLKELEDLREHMAERRATRLMIDKNQRLGRTVQKVVEAVFRAQGFDVRPAYNGYDFDAYDRGNVEQEDLGRINLEVVGKNYMVEVKTTRGSEVRMTETQAGTAVDYPDSYVLCVVDLSGKDIDDLNDEQLFRAVQDSIRIVDTIGNELRGVTDIALPSSKNVTVKLIGQIRYVINPNLWKEGGYTLQEWVAKRVRT